MVRVGADTKDMEKGLKTARAKMKAFGNQMKKIGKVAAVAGAAVVGAVGLMVKSYVKAGDEVHKMALRTGFSTEKLSELKYAAEISGASLETLEKGVKKMAKTILDASKSGGALATYVRAFEQIGLTAEELIDLSPEDQFDKIARAIANVENPTIRAARAQDIFGRAGTQLLPLFAEGAEGLDKLRKKAHELGLVFDQEAANKAAALNDAITSLKGSVTGVTREIAGALVPTLRILVDTATDVMVDVRGETGAMAQSVLGFFKLIVRGVGGLMMAWESFKLIVFKMGEEIIKYFGRLTIGIVIVTGFTKKMGILGKTHEAAKEALKNLIAMHGGYKKSADDQIEKITDIVIGMEKIIKALDEADVGYKKSGETIEKSVLPPARNLIDVFEKMTGVALPAARSLGDILGKAVTKMTSPVLEFKKAWQDTMAEILAGVTSAAGAMDSVFNQLHANEATRIENEAKQKTDAIESWFEEERAKLERTISNEEDKVAALEALDEEKARKENELQHRMDKERRKLERKRAKAQKVGALFAAGINVAEAITKALTAGPLIGQIFAGITAALGAIQVAAIAAAPLPSMAKGGMVEKEGAYRLHPGEEVRSAAAVKEQAGSWTFAPTINIYAKYLDDRTINQAAERIFARLERERGRFA